MQYYKQNDSKKRRKIKFYKIFSNSENLIRKRGWVSISKQPTSWIEAVTIFNGNGPSARYSPKKVIASYIYDNGFFREIFSYDENKFESMKKGGMIIFSTSVNSELDENIPKSNTDNPESNIDNSKSETNVKKQNKEKLKNKVNKIINWFKAKIQSLNNRLHHKSKITQILEGHPEIKGFSVGNYFSGRFFNRETNKIYDESSITVEILDIDRETLYDVAEELCETFNQTEVIVKDYESHDIKRYLRYNNGTNNDTN